MTESPRCVCGHRKYDHFLKSCDAGNKQCRCMVFRAESSRWDDDKEAGAIG
jgi:hypothetical protein